MTPGVMPLGRVDGESDLLKVRMASPRVKPESADQCCIFLHFCTSFVYAGFMNDVALYRD